MLTGKSEEITLWNKFRNGSERDLYGLYTRYYNDLFRYGLALVTDSELAKEYINRMFLSLWNKRTTLPEVESPRAYIITCYKNGILFRKENKHKPELSEIDFFDTMETGTAPYEETLIELQEYTLLRDRVNTILKSLTLRQKQMITMRFIDEMTYEEIACQLNISVRTVYNSIHSSLKLLRKQ